MDVFMLHTYTHNRNNKNEFLWTNRWFSLGPLATSSYIDLFITYLFAEILSASFGTFIYVSAKTFLYNWYVYMYLVVVYLIFI